jgi:flagellar biosynthesis protein FlhG
LVAANLAIDAAQAGARALLVDTDFGIAGQNLLLGVAPNKSVLDALAGAPLDHVLVKAHGIELLPALNGSHLLATLGSAGLYRILDLVDSLATSFDTLVLDIAAGIGAPQTLFAGAAAEVIVVVSPEPQAIAGAYACLKVLCTERGIRRAFVVPNRVQSQAHSDEVFAKLSALVHRFLVLELTALPAIPHDPAVGEAAVAGVPLLLHTPNAPAARALRQVASMIRALESTPGSWWRTQGIK